MKILRKEISKKVLTFVFVALFTIGLASAALVGYISNSITATVDVQTPILMTGLETGAYDDNPTGLSYLAPVDNVITVPLTNTYQGGETIITVKIKNNANYAVNTGLNLSLLYKNELGDIEPTDVITGEEFDVIGTREWNQAIGRWDPKVDNNPFSTTDCTDYGVTAPGQFNSHNYLSNDGSSCFWNFADDITEGVNALGMAANPISISTSDMGITIPVPANSETYGQIALRTRMSGGTVIAPGEYTLTLQATS